MEYYTEIENSFKLKENRVFNSIVLLLFLVLLVYLYYTEEKSDNMPLWLLGLLPTALLLFKVLRQVSFNKAEKVLEISIFGISIQKQELKNFKGFLTTKHSAFFIFNNGKEVKCIFDEANGNEKKISLVRKNKFKDINSFLNETQNIITTITNIKQKKIVK